jgi:hypothetical protein
MNVDRFALTNAIDAIRCLCFDSRIPPASIVNDVIGFCNRQSYASYERGQDYHIETGTVPEAIQHFVSRAPRLLATQATSVGS